MLRNDLVGFDSISIDDFFRTVKAIGCLWLTSTSREESGNIKLNTLSLESVFVVHQVGRYDIAGKKFFERGEKYFFENMGIRNVIYETFYLPP